jgi:membrane protein YqaA with SNARE-associated domain
MSDPEDTTYEPPCVAARPSRRARTVAFALQIALVAGLLLAWLNSETIRVSKNLWVLFLYSIPSEFLIAVVPHEPVILYFSKFYSALTVAIVSVTGTLLTEALNYSVFGFIADTKAFRRVRRGGMVDHLVDLFKRAPFAALWVAGFTPIPFYPFRLLVVLARYPIAKYLLAVLLSRTPRFFIFAYVGRVIGIPDYLLLALFAVLILVGIVEGGLARKAFRRRRLRTAQATEGPEIGTHEARDPTPE